MRKSATNRCSETKSELTIAGPFSNEKGSASVLANYDQVSVLVKILRVSTISKGYEQEIYKLAENTVSTFC